MRNIHLFVFILVFTVGQSIEVSGQSGLLTVAESSGFTSTSTHSEVLGFIEGLASFGPLLRVDTFAFSVEGRPLPLLVIADPMPADLSELADDPRVVLYIQANIHPGEVEGKEASLMLARDFLADPPKNILENVVLLICPNLNPDGNDRISTENRKNQVGPVNGVGVRHNAQHLDLNRDAIKLESPELKGVVTEILNKWDPAITVDCHTTNGSYHEEPITFTWMMNPNGDRNLIHYMRDQMMPAINKKLLNERGVENVFYGEFIDRLNPDSGWISYASGPRYLVNYIGIRNRLAILNENYVYADYQTRVMGCYHFLWTLVEYAAANKKGIKDLIAASDRQMRNRFSNGAPADSFAIEYKGVPTPEMITIKAIEADTIPGMKGYWRFRQSDRKRTVTVPYIADYIPVKNIALPFAYLITVSDPDVLENLNNHGFELYRLEEKTTLQVENFRIEKLSPRQRLFQGHYHNQAEGVLVTETREFGKGTYVVFTDQPLGNLAAYLLEPQSDDNLLMWNFFDRYLVPQWAGGYLPYPVYRLMDKTGIKTSKVSR